VVGPDHCRLLPVSAFLVAADLVSRLVVAPAERPVGIITVPTGVPVFL